MGGLGCGGGGQREELVGEAVDGGVGEFVGAADDGGAVGVWVLTCEVGAAVGGVVSTRCATVTSTPMP
jgi:hypothetical protein